MLIKVSDIQNNTGQIKGVPENPRTISKTEYEQIRHELSEHPEALQEEPLLLYDNDGHYVALGGNQRLRAIRDLGWKEIEHVGRIIPNGTPVKELQKRIIRHNLHAGEWDDDLLANEWDEADLEEWGYDMPDNWGEKDLPENVDDVPTLPTKPYSKQGDVWLLGKHRVMCGDSTCFPVVETLMQGQKADMCFTDPPYGVDYEGGHFHSGNVNIKRKRDKLISDRSTEIYTQAIPMISAFTDGPCYTFFAGTKPLELVSAISEQGEIHALLIWHKINATYAAMNAQYKQRHEPFYYWKPKGSTLRWCGATNEATIWELKKDAKNDMHPTQKPVELAVKAINNHKAKTVLDLFLGSGSTLIAAEQTGRQCYGLELEPKYVDVICKRYQQLTGNLPILEETGETHDFTT